MRDSAAALDATHGPDTGAPYAICPPSRSYLEEVGTSPGRLKIGFSVASPIGAQVHPDCIKGVEDTARLLEALGHLVEEKQAGVDGKAVAKSYLTMNFGEVAADLREIRAFLGRKVTASDVEPTTYTLGLLGRALSAGDFVEAMRTWDRSARQMGVFFREYDLYMTPTTAQPPARIGAIQPSPVEKALMKVVNTLEMGRLLKATGMVDQLADKSLARTPFTQLANLCGLPAMSVPLHWNADGLPCGTHFIAPFGREDRLFQLAVQLEEARRAGRKPQVWAA